MIQSSCLAQYFDELLQLYPSLASFLGDRSVDGEFENVFSKSHNVRYGRMMRKYERLMAENHERSVDAQILRWIIKDDRDSIKHPLSLIPLTSFENYVIDFVFMNKTSYPLKTRRDAQNLLRRYQVFSEIMHYYIRKMRVGIRRRIVMPKLICEILIKSLEEFLRSKKYVIDIPVDLPEYTTFVAGPFTASLTKLITFLKKEYLPHCTQTVGLCYLPQGKKMYRYLVKSNTTLSISPEYAHALGQREVRRILAEMNTVKVLLGHGDEVSVLQLNQKMLHNPRNFFTSEQRLMKAYKSLQQEINTQVIPQTFSKNVDPYVIKRVPRSMEQTSAGAFYVPGSIMSAHRRGTFYVNMRNMRENPKYSMMALSLHEGKPGHHYHFQYMIENKIPLYRQYAVNGTSFVEGWALYAESLGDYKNSPYEYFGKLTYEMFRAVRLVVDTGIHFYGWTYEEAVEYMSRYMAMSIGEIETEVQRYICMPAQALCYKIGERKIHSLKLKYIKTFGNNTQAIKKFHDLVLEDGVLPLSVLEMKILRIIKHERAKHLKSHFKSHLKSSRTGA